MKSRADNLKTRLLLIVTASICIQFSGFAQVVEIPDPQLRRAIQIELGKLNGDITVKDLESLTELDASGRGIKIITGLEHAVNLSVLDLGGNQLKSLTHSKLPPWLVELDLRGNPLTSLTSIERLESLQTLWISPTAVRDLSPVLDQLLFSGVHVRSNYSIPRRIIRDENGHVSIYFISGKDEVRILRSTDLISWETANYWRCAPQSGLFKDEKIAGFDVVFYRFEDETSVDDYGGCGLF